MILKVLIIFIAIFGKKIGGQLFDATPPLIKWRAEFSSKKLQTLSSHDDKICQNQLNEFDAALAKREMWALELFDTWVKVPVGYFGGNFEHMGNFDYCVRFRHETQSSGKIQGQHCFVTIQALPNSTLDAESELPDWREFANFIRPMDMKVRHGVCLPASCSPQMVNNYINSKFLFKNDLEAFLPEKCQTNDMKSFEWIDVLASVIFSFIIFLLIASTCYDITTRKEAAKRNKLFLSFSVYTNGKNLFEWSGAKSDSSIDSLHGLRALSIFWIIIGHRVTNQHPFANPNDLIQYITQSWSSSFLKIHHIAVDTFFVMGALLLTCSTLRDCDKERLNLPRMIWRRYIRYTPAFAALMLFTVSFLKFFMNGPYDGQALVDPCLKNWWYALLHIQNYLEQADMCLNHAWYLSADFQLFLITPFIIILIHKHGKLLLAIPVFLVIATIIYIITISMVLELYMPVVGGTIEFTRLIYFPTHSRMGPWFIGLVLGYFVYNHRGKIYKISSTLNAFMWIATLSLLLSIVLVQHIFAINPEVPLVWNAIYVALFRNLWAVGLCWIIFACQNLKTGGIVRWFLSLQFWEPFGRMGLSMYLYSAVYQVVSILNQRVPLYLNFWAFWGSLSGDILATIIIGAFSYCAFEAPPLIIEDYVYKKITKSKEK